MIRKTYKNTIFIAALLMMAACGNSSGYEEVARVQGIEAAKTIMAVPHDNMGKMERALLEIKAMQSEYMLKGYTLAVKAFDEAFKEYIIANDKELAEELFD